MSKNSKIVSFIVLLGALGVLIFYTIFPPKYDTKKYDKNMFSNAPDNTMTAAKQKFAQKRRHDTRIMILDDGTASLGDFIFNSGGNTKIVANISLKFKNSKDGWFNGNDAEEEIVKRGLVLRSAVIDTMMDNHGVQINDKMIKNKILDNVNYYLSDATATELYFNKFIIQH